MRDSDLATAAERAGLLTHWRDAFGADRAVTSETLRALLDIANPHDADPNAMAPLVVADASRPEFPALPKMTKMKTARVELEFGERRDCRVERLSNSRLRIARLPAGYHHVELGASRFVLAAAPSKCLGVADAAQSNERLWGIAAQLYSLRRKHDLGCGDFTALAQFVAAAAKFGASAVALSPVHAMFGARTASYSPYSPSNRAFLNVLCADTGAAADARRDRQTLIDWPKCARIHRRRSEALFKRFESGDVAGAAAFAEFRLRGGEALFGHACFEALDESPLAAAKPASGSAQATAFCGLHRQRVAFHQFMQWRASMGLASAQTTARVHGMPIGLIADLAVGVDPGGSECWSHPHDMLIGASIGAPPDALNAVGQDWGLTTFSPGALERTGFAPFLSILRAAMRYAGGVRLDHVMALMRLWLVPRGARAVDGAYLRYPFADLVRLVALESWRNRCIVIGEDLGTVPDDCRSRLSRAGILGLDVLAFMRDGKRFVPPARWRESAAAMTSTHDVAPVAAWWMSRDLGWRRKLRLFGDLDEASERRERDQAKVALARAAHVPARAKPDRIVDAAIVMTAHSPSPLAIVPVEDLVGAREQPNLPGTIAEHPNWRRRYRADATRLLNSTHVAARLKRLAHERPRIE